MSEIQDNPLLSAIDLGVALGSGKISVYFAKDGERLDFDTSQGNWTRYEKAMAMAALDAWAAVADLDLRVVPTAETATFRLMKSPSVHGSLGYMNPPDPAYGETKGIAWFNSAPYWSGAAGGMLDPGS